jgi:hypothetical protein
MPPSLAPLPGRHAASDEVRGRPVPVLVAAWCRSVGTTWTLELRSLDHGELAGRVVDWIPSGVPTSQPVPDTSAENLLAERGLVLFRDASGGSNAADANQPSQRRVIGPVTRDAEAMRLARTIAEEIGANPIHPLVLAAQWIGAGFSADAATGWVRGGVVWPQVAATLISTEFGTGGQPAPGPHREYSRRV